MKQLLALQLDLNMSDAYGCTPLHYAVNSKQVVEIPLKAGADPKIADKRGRIPIDYATRTDVVVILSLATP